jgi:hypothetical protein
VKLLNRRVRGRHTQVLLHVPRPRALICGDYTLWQWWDEAMLRRGRGYYPRSGPWPIFYYWLLGPLDVRRWTPRAQAEQDAHPMGRNR